MIVYKQVKEEGYRLGSDGTAWSRWTKRGLGKGKGSLQFLGDAWRLLKAIHSGSGYVVVHFHGKQYRLGRLMLETFIGPCPEGMECRHLDGNKDNNSIENLAWGTPVENAADRDRHGKTAHGEKIKSSRFTETDVRLMHAMSKKGVRQVDIAKMFSTNNRTVWMILHGRRWRQVHEEMT